MIEIQNSESYYKLPSLYPNIFQQHLPESMVYRAMYYVADTFVPKDIHDVLGRLWGIELNNQKLSYGLQILREKGYITRSKPNVRTYTYHKTTLYKRDLMSKL